MACQKFAAHVCVLQDCQHKFLVKVRLEPRKFVLLASADARTRLKVQAHICPFVAALS